MDTAVQRVIALLSELLDQGIEPPQIKVLGTTKSFVERLHGRDVAGIGLVDYGDDGVVVETVQRFKGLEADVVIIVILEAEAELDLSLTYTGLSRAQTMLEVIGTRAVMEAIHWGLSLALCPGMGQSDLQKTRFGGFQGLTISQLSVSHARLPSIKLYMRVQD